jgi:acyl-CoA reductase-like NAD-dependent aldehyde dehydrogenase
MVQETDTSTHKRYIRKVPVGVVFCISPWNWPLFCQINVVLPALIAGNAVILKPSPQTPLCGEVFLEAFAAAGLPENVLQVLHLTLDQGLRIVSDPRIGFVNFTGSVEGGRAVSLAAAKGFKGTALEVSATLVKSHTSCAEPSLGAKIQRMSGPMLM